MSNYNMLLLVNGKETRKESKDLTMDFTAVRIGADNLSIAQGGSGGTAYLDAGARAIRTSFVAANDNDLVNRITLMNEIASIVGGVEWQDSVLSRLDTPPGTPTTGDRYLIIATATGDWAGQENKIAEWNGSAWVFTAPTTGMAVLVDDEPTAQYVFGSTTWGAKYFESTTASGFLEKTGFDITLKNLADGKIILGDGSNIAQAVTLTGDVTVSNTGVTAIGALKVLESMINTGAVTETKIGAGAVTVNKIGDDAVTKAKVNADVAGTDLRQATDGSLEMNSSLSYTNDNASAITVRQVVYLKANGNVDLADATVATVWETLIGMVEDATIASSAAGKVFVRPGKVVGGFTGLTVGAHYYLDNATPGLINKYADITWAVGNNVVRVGKAISATELQFKPEFMFEY